ncbi:HesB/IscA family protein [Teredinibacter waterburyi]|uniref:HesB/IscA family protein n=1 Tax=Teredinibacter waterburyi TaxID=1500538 RepID=UPI00165EC164|nr:iron-sulfur cluster assembly accessory protein [Teredinibacter waterburyi]
MTVETFSAADAITITPTAAEHFYQQLQKSKAAALRISLKESGCTGFMYVIDEVESAQSNDIEFTLDNGVQIYMDTTHMAAIHGTVVDYVRDGLNQNLVLNNPNVKESCGCGESFSV